MTSTFPKRCLAFFMDVAKVIFHLNIPFGYEDDYGFHLGKN